MKPVPSSVIDPRAVSLYESAQHLRAQLKQIAIEVEGMISDSTPGVHVHRQVIANATLAFRHIEDASHRLGRVLQHLDGGVSVYDKATTVGAPVDPEACAVCGIAHQSIPVAPHPEHADTLACASCREKPLPNIIVHRAEPDGALTFRAEVSQ